MNKDNFILQYVPVIRYSHFWRVKVHTSKVTVSHNGHALYDEVIFVRKELSR